VSDCINISRYGIDGVRFRVQDAEAMPVISFGIHEGLGPAICSMRTILQAEDLEKVYRVGKVDVPAFGAYRCQSRRVSL